MRMIKRSVTAMLLFLAVLAAGTLLQEALRMYRDDTLRSHPEAIAALERAASGGNTDAAFLLATAYRDGKTGRRDVSAALHWYRSAARRGDADAMLMLGWLYYKGDAKGTPDETEAKRWFEKAAAKGVDEAVEMLEIMQEG